MTPIWELDFYSRPILDDAGKKRWEVLICESPLTTTTRTESLFRYCQYCPSDRVNSIWLGEAIQAAIAAAGQPPTLIRFFRRQMGNMITKACKDLDLTSRLSRRTLTLAQWLEERAQTVYPNEPGYQAIASASVQYALDPIAALPDALRGDRWTLVSLPVADFADMADWDIGFGEGFPLEPLGLTPEMAIPGILIFSSRALPLAAWMSGLELGFVALDAGPPANLVLETGTNDRWLLASLTQAALVEEAQRFEVAKAKANNVHFIGIPTDNSAEKFAGFWLMQQLILG